MSKEEGSRDAPYTTHHYGNPNDPEDHKDEQEIIGSCTIDALGNYTKGNPKVLVFFSQEGCNDCDMMRSVVDETIKDKMPVIEAGTEDKQCADLSTQLNVGITPTLIYYENGKETERMVPDGKMTWDGMRQKLRELADKPVAPVPTPS